jgi:hypothetical protein
LLITKPDLAAPPLGVFNNASALIGTIPAAERGFVLARFSALAGDWIFAEGGSLAG